MDDSTNRVVTAADVAAAADRIVDAVHRTPLDPSTTLADRTGAAEVRLKLENLQRTGSFKARGATNRVRQLPEGDLAAGVVTISSGNHAQGVAYAARAAGADATIVMPESTPAAKVAATRGYGAAVVRHGEHYRDLHEKAMELVAERGLTMVHPFDDPAVIAGQGTVGREVVEEFPDVDTVVAAVGGGGLISGVATAAKAHDPDVRVVGVQTDGAAHVNESLRRGEMFVRDDLDTVAEGIAAGRMEPNTLRIVRERVDEVVEVPDEAVPPAMALLAERANTVAEAAGALPVAAMLDGAIDVAGERVAAVVSGGNVGLAEHRDLCRAGLDALGRYRRVRLELRDWSALGAVAATVEDEGAELDDVRRESVTAADDPNRHPVTAAVEGTGTDHLDDVLAALGALPDVAVGRRE